MRFLIVAIAFVLFDASIAEAQEKRTMYPYSVFNKKSLSVGATVWVNLGDTECAYAQWRKHPEWKFEYAMPSASDECFREYRKARIVKVLYMYRRYVYRVQYEPWVDQKDGFRYEWNAEFDRLYEIFNLPEESEWRKYSKYFLALNW